MFNKPDIFNTYILGSPSVWYNDNAILKEIFTEIKTPTKVWLSVGSLETPEFGEGQNMVAGAKALAEKITQWDARNLTLQFRVIDGATHETAFPTTAIQGMHWVYDKK